MLVRLDEERREVRVPPQSTVQRALRLEPSHPRELLQRGDEDVDRRREELAAVLQILVVRLGVMAERCVVDVVLRSTCAVQV